MPAKNLSEQLTVFVLTVGDERNFGECMACLERQTAGFRLEVIDQVAPMAAAMAEMISRCRTPFYIQVDEDMHLFPEAVESLYDAIAGAPPKVALVSWPLWDCDIERAIYGVKVYRHEILRAFPYKDVHSAERDQDLRLMDAGFEVVSVPLNGRAGCLGEHGKYYTPRSIYIRWRRQCETRRLDDPRRGRGVPGPSYFLERFVRDPQPLHLYSLLGVIAALIREDPPDRSRNYHDPLPDFDRLAEAFAGADFRRSDHEEDPGESDPAPTRASSHSIHPPL